MSKSTPQAPPTPDPSLVTQRQTGANQYRNQPKADE
jgi:hypothetical protein